MVSAIICFYNEEKYLSESIESVVNQSYSDWELLLVDDGSRDGSTEIAIRYSRKYFGKIKYLDHTGHNNKGLSASRNLGISSAVGEFIAFLDADDAWMPEKLQLQVDLLKGNSEVDLICGATKYWYSWQSTDKKDDLIFVGTEQNKFYRPPELIKILYPLGQGAAPSMSGLIIKKEALLRVGGFEEEFKGMYEDQVFLCKNYLNNNVWVSNICFDNYRQHDESMFHVAMKAGEYNKIRFYFLDWLKNYLKKQGVEDKKVEQLLKKAMFPYEFPLLNKAYLKIIKLFKKF